MISRKAKAVWEGSLKEGTGHMSVESGLFSGPYSFKSRFKDKAGTNPEELIGAAHAGCFSMALSDMLSGDGYEVESIETEAKVFLGQSDDSFEIIKIELNTKGRVAGIDSDKFIEYAKNAKENCPVSKALKSVKEIVLNVEFES